MSVKFRRFEPNSEPEMGKPTPPKVETLNGLPAVELPGVGRALGDFAEELGTLLAKSGVYSRGGHAFTIDRDGKKLEAVNSQWLRTWAEKEVSLFKTSRRGEGESIRFAHSMTLDTAKALCVSPQFLDELPEIRRFHPVRLPVLRESGRVELLPPGFDEESLTRTDPKGCEYRLDLEPEKGRAILDEVLSEFPFSDERSRAASIAAMVTVYAGGLLPDGSIVPSFVYLANAEGSGKTTLATLAGIPYGAITAKPAPTSEAEWAKRLLALTMSGQRLAILDNVRGHLNSPSLEAYISATHYGDRILGVSKEFEGEADAVILLTGNRLSLTPDMRRRSIFVELFMRQLRAEDRTFKRRLDPPAILEMQSRLLAALWAIVRGWDEAGRPKGSHGNASFPRWAETVGGIVEAAGYASPATTPDLEDGGDSDTRDIAQLGEAMKPGDSMKFAEVCELCGKLGLFERFTNDQEDDGTLSRKARSAFPKALKPYDGRTVAQGKRFKIEGKGHSKRYLIQKVAR
ncbi:hypothetical protein N9B65_07270 [Akkermansiaceae bacterium]|nr:hypothetical protein [Akkermansiaceae bacterium]